MAERIYTRDEHKGLEPLEEEPFCSEDMLQALIANNPEVLDGGQVRPDDPRRWILITREKGIAERSDAGGRWSLDHLLIDQDAVPTLVEVKRSSNSELRRTFVGQLLEYAAHAAVTWTANELCQTFESTGDGQAFDPDEKIKQLLQTDIEPDVEAFWKAVETNLAARRLRLLFVADEIPDPLERVITFLNEQMPHIEVLGVEIKQFRGESFQTLVPRVIGRVAALEDSSNSGTGPRRKLTRASFLEELPNEEARSVARKLLDTATAAGATLWWGSSSVSIRMPCKIFRQPVTVAWLHSKPGVPFWMGFRDITFGAATFDYSLPPELRKCLERWVAEFNGDDFADDISGKGTKAWAVRYSDAAKNAELLTSRIVKVLSELKEL